MSPKMRLSRRSLLASTWAAGIGGYGEAILADQPERGASREGTEARPIPYASRVAETRGGRCVGFPLYTNATLLDFAGATQVIAFAGYQPIWLAERKGPIRTSEGVSVEADYTFDDHPLINILFVPGGAPDGVVSAMFDRTYQRFLSATAEQATWTGAVCVGAFILAAAHLLDGCEATTYWSQIPNLGLLSNKMRITIAPGYPRSCIDIDRKRFTGGGVSSSIDLALELVELTGGKWGMERAQLTIQYAPDPPVRAGDPSQAPVELTKAVLDDQRLTFVEPIHRAVQRILAS